MDFVRLAAFVTEVNRSLPKEFREKVANGIDKVVDVLAEVDEALSETAEQPSKENVKRLFDDTAEDEHHYDFTINLPEDESDVQRMAQEIIDRLTAEDERDSAPDEVGTESGGSVSISDITSSIYMFLVENHDSYASYSEEAEAWNVKNPLYVTIDYLQFLGDNGLPGSTTK